MTDDIALSPQAKTCCRRTRRGDERCERVTAVAAELFLERGYDGVSLDDIIAKAGGSKTNIYSRFGGKEGLFTVVVAGLCDEITEQICEVTVCCLTLEEGLRQIGLSMLRTLLQERPLALYRLVVSVARRFPAIGAAWAEHGPDAAQKIIADFIRSHQSGTPRLTPEEAAVLFHNMVMSDRMERAVCGLQAAGGASTVEAAVTLFMRGYA